MHDGCCPPGWLPPPFVQETSVVTGVILACTGVASDETSVATDSATAMAASAANVTLCVFPLFLTCLLGYRVHIMLIRIVKQLDKSSIKNLGHAHSSIDESVFLTSRLFAFLSVKKQS